MMPKIRRRATLACLISLLAGLSGCSKTPADPSAGTPVSGRVVTGAGISIDFPAGWVETPRAGRPFTKTYENKSGQLEIRLVDSPADGMAISTSGEQVKRGLSHDGTVAESRVTTVAGRPAFRLVVLKKTPTGGTGIVVALVILRADDRHTTIYVASLGDEKPNHRAEIDALLNTIEVQ